MRNFPYIIAEIAQAHDGSLGMAHSYIDALADTGVSAVKFQIHIAEAESSIYEPFRVKFSYKDKTRIDYWKRMEFSLDEWKGLKKHCEQKGLEFIATPFSIEALNLLKSLNVKKIKIGSGDSTNLLLLKKAASLKKEIILSTGLSDIKEIENSIRFLKKYCKNISVLHCTTKYPTPPVDWGLNFISILKNKFKIPVGYSDHSGNIYASLAAAALGAEIFEFHVVFDKNSFGPDSSSSIEIRSVLGLVSGIKDIYTALNVDFKKSNVIDKNVKTIFGKSICVNRTLSKNQIIKFEYLDTKKPFGMGIPVNEFDKVIGKKLKRDLTKWSFLNKSDLQ